MKTVHWPRRCPPLSSLNLNRLLGHASKGRILGFSRTLLREVLATTRTRHRSCLFYSWRGATWSGSGDGPAIAAGDLLTFTDVSGVTTPCWTATVG